MENTKTQNTRRDEDNLTEIDCLEGLKRLGVLSEEGLEQLNQLKEVAK